MAFTPQCSPAATHCRRHQYGQGLSRRGLFVATAGHKKSTATKKSTSTPTSVDGPLHVGQIKFIRPDPTQKESSGNTNSVLSFRRISIIGRQRVRNMVRVKVGLGSGMGLWIGKGLGLKFGEMKTKQTKRLYD